VSTPYIEIEGKINELSSLGHSAFMLAGLNLGCYDAGGLSLADVLERVNALPAVGGIWLSSLEPMNIDNTFIGALPRVTKLCRNLHISLQSGCDQTLSRMNRKYGYAGYKSIIENIRDKMPGIAITTDIIVGFPGESERDFEESIENIVACNFSDIHIFKFSPRRGTPAEDMDGQATEHQKSRRALLLKGVKMQARYQFYSRFVGNVVNTLITRRIDETSWEGLTEHNFPVSVQGAATPDRMLPVRITGFSPGQDSFTGVFV